MLSGDLAKWFALVNPTYNYRPFRWRDLPVGMFWRPMTLGTRDNQWISQCMVKRISRRICTGRAWLRVVHKEIISLGTELV